MSLADKRARAEHVNQAVRIIGNYGRRFFFNAKWDRYASIEVDARGRIWWVDEYTMVRIYTHRTTWGNKWYHFSHGGTLRDLVELFRDYIRTGKPVHAWFLGPERQWSDGNIWGYPPEDMQKVRDLAGVLPCFRMPAEASKA